MKRAIGIATAAIVLGVAASALAANKAAVTTTIIRQISMTANADLSFGTIMKSGTGSGTVRVTTANVATVTGKGAVLLPSSAVSAANITVSGKGAQTFTLAIDPKVTLTNTAPPGGTLTVTTVSDAGCAPSCSLPGALGVGTDGNKVINVAGSIPFNSTTRAGSYAGNLTINVIYN